MKTSHIQFLVTWFHPVERTFTLAADTWVIGRNDDFGYEITCALVQVANEGEAKAAVVRGYRGNAIEVKFYSCAACECDSELARFDCDQVPRSGCLESRVLHAA